MGYSNAQFFRVGGNRYLRYSLDRSARVSVRIYDMQGRLQAKVFDAVPAQGVHTITLPADLSQSLHLLEFRTGAQSEWHTIYP